MNIRCLQNSYNKIFTRHVINAEQRVKNVNVGHPYRLNMIMETASVHPSFLIIILVFYNLFENYINKS